MASCSPYLLSVCSHPKPHVFVSNRPFNRGPNGTHSLPTSHLRSPLRFPTKLQTPPRLRSSACEISFSHGSKPQPKNPFLRSCAEKLAILLVGSLLFVGRLTARPALALPDPPTSTASTSLEEKSDGQGGKFEEEEELYERILEKNPRDMEALKMALYAKMRKGRMKEAAECVERMIELQPDEVEWMLLQALCYELSGDLGKAKRVFKEILAERPLTLRALHGLAMVMHKNREGFAVFEMLNKALELARREKRVTEEQSIKILIAQMHVVKGDLEGASKQFQVLIKENPRDFRPYLCQGIVYSLLDKRKEADEHFEIYKSLVPDEFPQRSFMDDVIVAAKTESQGGLKKEFESEISDRI